jgi:hypothetical protein
MDVSRCGSEWSGRDSGRWGDDAASFGEESAMSLIFAARLALEADEVEE